MKNVLKGIFFLGFAYLNYQISQYIFGDWPTDEQLDQAWDYMKDTFDNPDKAINDVNNQLDEINPQSDLDRMQSEILEKYKDERKSSYWGSSESEAITIEDGIKIYTSPWEKGETPVKVGDKLSIGYSAHFYDGKVFETNIDYVAEREGLYNKNSVFEPLVVEVGGPQKIIPGVMKALKHMRVGDRSEIFIPAKEAFGARGNNNVPPNTDVVYMVEILDEDDLILFGSRPWDFCFKKEFYENGYLSGTPTLLFRNLPDRKVEGYYIWEPPVERGTWGGTFTGKFVEEDLIEASGRWSQEGEDYEVSFKITIKEGAATVDHPYRTDESYTLDTANCEDQLY